jgi:hypothetical protein
MNNTTKENLHLNVSYPLVLIIYESECATYFPLAYNVRIEFDN